MVVDVDGEIREIFVYLATRILEAVHSADDSLGRLVNAQSGALSLLPNEPVPLMSGVFNAPIYGHNTWESLFNSRQYSHSLLIPVWYATTSACYRTESAIIKRLSPHHLH